MSESFLLLSCTKERWYEHSSRLQLPTSQEKRPQHKTYLPGTLILDFPASGIVRNKFMLLPFLWYFVMAVSRVIDFFLMSVSCWTRCHEPTFFHIQTHPHPKHFGGHIKIYWEGFSNFLIFRQDSDKWVSFILELLLCHTYWCCKKKHRLPWPKSGRNWTMLS